MTTSNAIHLNNAGASPLSVGVLETCISYLKREQAVGGYEAAAEASEQLGEVYEVLARLVGAKSGEVAFMDSATRAWNSVVYALPLRPGDRILTTASEFGSNVVSLAHVAKRSGAHIDIIPTDESGTVSAQTLADIFDDKVRLVAVTHFAAHRGIVNPVEELGQFLRDKDAFYLVDACQSVGQTPIDVGAIGCDALTGTGRKWLRGPRGTGFLYVSEPYVSTLEPLTLDLAAADLAHPELKLRSLELVIRPDVKRFETWERSLAMVLGLGAAAAEALEIGVETIRDKVATRAQSLRKRLVEISSLKLGESVDSGSGIITLSSTIFDVEEIKIQLKARGIYVSTMHDYDGPLDLGPDGTSAVLRISPHYFNTSDDIDVTVAAIEEICR